VYFFSGFAAKSDELAKKTVATSLKSSRVVDLNDHLNGFDLLRRQFPNGILDVSSVDCSDESVYIGDFFIGNKYSGSPIV
jgi:hypothetical protein